jgi:hypothetical protein
MKMNDREEIVRFLYDVIGEEGCGVSCCEAEVIEDDKGWNMKLEGFMEPWFLGKTVEDAKASIKGYASMGFGLS